MFNALWNLLFFALALGILITIHEWGHFIVARMMGIRVLRFSIGFGPVIFKKQGKNGCEYALSLIPLGGYVKMQGEQDKDSMSCAKDSFASKKLYQRACVIAAGPFFNIVLAIFLYAGLNMHGVTTIQPVVGDVIPHSEAEKQGFKVYDRVFKIQGKDVNSWSDVMVELLPYIGSNDNLKLEVAGNFGKDELRTLRLNTKNMSVDRNDNPLLSLGLRPCTGKIDSSLGTVLDNSPAQRAGLVVGDDIVEINGIKTSSWYRIADTIAKSNAKELNLLVKRDGKIYTTKVIPEFKYNERLKKSVPVIGIGVNYTPLPELSKTVSYGFFEAINKGIDDTVMMSKIVVTAITKLLSGAISSDNISGPIAIAKGAGESASYGLAFFISFLAAISVNLGILNLLPIPVLDGGQLMFLAYEAIARRKPSIKVQSVLTSVGFAILLTLMLFAVFNDLKGL